MRVIVAGSRSWDDEAVVEHTLNGWLAFDPSLEIVSGMAKGADTHAAEWARRHNRPLHPFPADWDKHGKAAGPIRNAAMIDRAMPELVIAFADNLGESRGTADLIKRAKRAGVPVYLVSRP